LVSNSFVGRLAKRRHATKTGSSFAAASFRNVAQR